MKLTRVNLEKIGEPILIHETKYSIEIEIENGDRFSIREKNGTLQIMKQSNGDCCMHIQPSASNVIEIK